MTLTLHPLIEQHYSFLNEAQREAIARLDGPLLIIAGPGSGKTLVLVIRTLNILLQEKAQPKEIVLCTFTEKAAFELRDRVAQAARRLGYTEDLSQLQVSTIHGICNHYLNRFRHNTWLNNTAERDVWVAYSRIYAEGALAPAYLAHPVAQNEVAGEVSRFIISRHAPGDMLTSSELRRHMVARYGERKVVTNAASAFLHTLQYFGVLAPGERPGDYYFSARLPVPREVFPLLVWTWWQAHRSPQIDLDDFAATPAMAFLEPNSLAEHWTAYQPALWVLEERLEGRRATLKYGEAEELEESLLKAVGS